MKPLRQAVSDAIDHLISPDNHWSNNAEWVSGRGGEVYVRYVKYADQVDLANFAISKRYQHQGIAKGIIEDTCAKDVALVRVENVLNTEWLESLRTYSFPYRETHVEDKHIWPASVWYARPREPAMQRARTMRATLARVALCV